MQTTRKFAVSILLSIVVTLVLISALVIAQSETADGFITPREAHKLLTAENPPLLIDVRTEAEFEDGHLKEALNVPLNEFTKGAYAKKIGEPKKDELILVFCRSGRRSGIVRNILVKDGYTNVKNVRGGLIAWKEAELPLTKEVEGAVGSADKPTSNR